MLQFFVAIFFFSMGNIFFLVRRLFRKKTYWIDYNHLKILEQKFYVHLMEPFETEQRKKQDGADDSSFDLNKSCNVSAF